MMPLPAPSLPLDVRTERSHKLLSLLKESVLERSADALLLSGGLDSSLLAALDPSPMAVTVGIPGLSSDLLAARRVAGYLGLRWHCVDVTIEDMLSAVERLVRLAGSYDPGLLHDVPLLLGIEHARDFGARSIRSGEAADILFGGYSSTSHVTNYRGFLADLIPRMTLRVSQLAASCGLSCHNPYFSRAIRAFSLTLREEERQVVVQTEHHGDVYQQKLAEVHGHEALSGRRWGKILLRRCALGMLPMDVIFRQKADSGYGTGMQAVEEALAAQVPDGVYEWLMKTAHPFYNKAHARLFQIFYNSGCHVPRAVLPTRCCSWCSTPLGSGHHCRVCGAYGVNKDTISDVDDTSRRLELRRALPLLRHVPDEVYFQVTLDEFFFPDENIQRVREQLELATGGYVMTYRKGVFLAHLPPRAHLCMWIEACDLSSDDLAALQRCEESVEDRGVSFVVYRKPVAIKKAMRHLLQTTNAD